MPHPSKRVIYKLLCEAFEEMEQAGLLYSNASDFVSFEAAELITNHPILLLSDHLQVIEETK